MSRTNENSDIYPYFEKFKSRKYVKSEKMLRGFSKYKILLKRSYSQIVKIYVL